MSLEKVKTKFTVKELFEKKPIFQSLKKFFFKSFLKSALKMKAGYRISTTHHTQGTANQKNIFLIDELLRYFRNVLPTH